MTEIHHKLIVQHKFILSVKLIAKSSANSVICIHGLSRCPIHVFLFFLLKKDRLYIAVTHLQENEKVHPKSILKQV